MVMVVGNVETEKSQKFGNNRCDLGQVAYFSALVSSSAKWRQERATYFIG